MMQSMWSDRFYVGQVYAARRSAPQPRCTRSRSGLGKRVALLLHLLLAAHQVAGRVLRCAGGRRIETPR